MRVIGLLLAGIFAATPASAEPIDIKDALSKIDGLEVSITGEFGTVMGDYRLTSEAGSFAVELAVTREALAAVRDCKIDLFLSDDACTVDMLAEIRIDGGSIVLVAYEITKK